MNGPAATTAVVGVALAGLVITNVAGTAGAVAATAKVAGNDVPTPFDEVTVTLPAALKFEL
jgi:hypothetical protein